MRKQDIAIGGYYTAKVSGNLTVVRIIGDSAYGGWDAENMRTGCRVRIKTASRLRTCITEDEMNQFFDSRL